MDKKTRKALLKEWKKNGVSFIDEDSVFFDEKVKLPSNELLLL